MSADLSGFPLLKSLSEEGRELLGDFLEERSLRDGEMVFSEGDESGELYLVVEGQVRLEARGAMVDVIGRGESFGAGSLVVIGNRECDALCEEPVRLLVLSRESYVRLRSDHPQLALDLQEAILCELARVVRSVLPGEGSSGLQA
ncbi:MAG: cyclic nucleotide-binding domain-containing protein [Myxococcota bacterium]